MTPALHDFVSQAAAVAVAAATLLALTRRGGTRIAGIATAALSAPTLLLLALHQGPEFALLAAVGTLFATPLCDGLAMLALRWLGRGTDRSAPVPKAAVWPAALLAGVTAAGVCAAARDLGPLGSGLIGGLPVVAACTLLGTRRHGGASAAARYVRAYRRGLRLRVVTTLVFAAAVLPLGPVWAMCLALIVSGLVVSWQPQERSRRPALPAARG